MDCYLAVTVQNNKTTLKSEKSKDSGIEILDDSFVCFEDTQMLISKNNKDSINVQSNRHDIKISNDYSITQEYDSSQISQFFKRTQVLKQLDSIVSEANSNIKRDILQDSTNTSHNVKQNFKDITNQAGTSSNLYSNSKETKDLLKKFNNRSTLENKEEANFLSSSFIDKGDVNNLFSKLETTIRDMGGANRCPNVITDQNQDAIKNITLLNSIVEKVKTTKSDQEDHWLNETEIGGLINMTEIEMFPSILREASLLNEFKTQDFAKELNSITSFKSLGNFYNLPDKVKQLFKLYRSIETLYGRGHFNTSIFYFSYNIYIIFF